VNAVEIAECVKEQAPLPPTHERAKKTDWDQEFHDG